MLKQKSAIYCIQRLRSTHDFWGRTVASMFIHWTLTCSSPKDKFYHLPTRNSLNKMNGFFTRYKFNPMGCNTAWVKVSKDMKGNYSLVAPLFHCTKMENITGLGSYTLVQEYLKCSYSGEKTYPIFEHWGAHLLLFLPLMEIYIVYKQTPATNTTCTAISWDLELLCCPSPLRLPDFRYLY